jgi:hypothetical protein
MHKSLTRIIELSLIVLADALVVGREQFLGFKGVVFRRLPETAQRFRDWLVTGLRETMRQRNMTPRNAIAPLYSDKGWQESKRAL